ncbi:MAG: NFACT RNA binding domain-containing protein [Myxococcaceae bacterium]|nr:NFACT RNA binding domain-containing protein [Myxococcaceae bacterium]MCI0670794.1 NFACT RNA binding domain-containing protein [Myxococcaceae bacterium]
MSLRPEELERVARELAERLVGAVVQKAFSPFPRLAYLELRQPGRSVVLCASGEPELARLSVASERLPSPGEPTPFQRWLRQELVGLRLTDVEARGRLALLRFASAEEQRVLVVDLAPPGALVLTTRAGRILALSQQPGAGRAGLHPGATHPAVEAPSAPVAPLGEATGRLVPVEGAAFPLAEAAEALHADLERRRRADAIRRRLAQPYRARLSRLDRTLEKVRREAGREEDAERHRRLGELLAQNLHRVPRGAARVRLTSYTEAGVEEVEVVLDARRSPREQVDWHFHQYRRLLRGSEHAAHRLKELEREERAAREALSQLDAMDEASLLAQLEVLAQPTPAEAQGAARPFREYLSSRGHRIWVGRGGEANDVLTFRLARPHDLWLHARGVPGAHVVVPLTRGATVEQETLLDAAHLALHHSDLKGEPRGEVSHVPVRSVRRVKGGAPGQVTFSQEKTFVVRVEPERLKRLLGTPELPPSV